MQIVDPPEVAAESRGQQNEALSDGYVSFNFFKFLIFRSLLVPVYLL